MPDGADEGYIKLYRAIQDSEVWGWPHSHLKFWVYLLLQARWRPAQVGDVRVERGQVLRSYRKMAEDCQWTENRQTRQWSTSTIKAMLRRLEDAEMVVNRSTRLCTLIEICNFDKWQQLMAPEGRTTEHNPERDHRTTLNTPEPSVHANDRGGDIGTLNGTAEQPPNNNKKGEELKKHSLSRGEPPKIRDLYLQEMVQKHNVDLELEWSGFRAYVEASGRRYDNLQKAWQGWVVREIRNRESRRGRVNQRTGSKKPWED